MTDQAGTLVVEIPIAAPVETVWRALRDPAEIRRWHGWEYDGLDEEIDAIYLSGADASEEDGTIDLRGADTRIAVEASGDGTVVRVTRGSDPLSEGDSRGEWNDAMLVVHSTGRVIVSAYGV